MGATHGITITNVARNGTIERLPSGSWRVTVQRAGRRYRRTVVGDRAAAQRVLAELHRQADATNPLANVPTVRSMLEDRFSDSSLADTTMADYRGIADRLPDRFIDMPIDRITPVIVDRLWRDLTAEGWSRHRITRARSLLSPCFDRAVRLGITASNPVSAVKVVAPVDRPVNPPDPADVAKALASATGWKLIAFRLAAATGARRGEIAGLQWGDVDFAANELTIQRVVTYTRATGMRIRPGTKAGRNKVRTIAIDGGTMDILRHWRAERAALALAAGVPLPRWLLTDRLRDEPLLPNTITHAWHDIAEANEMHGVRLHDLRHHAATQLLAANIDVRTVAGRLGQSRVSTTLDRYAAFVPSIDDRAAQVLGRIADGLGT